jgi:lipopolysaccharide transport periplasmic protein LptA
MRRHLKLALSLWLALPLGAAALESDRQQPIQVQADSVELDNRTGVSTYRGNVVLDQGTLHLEADLLKVYRGNDELDRIEAEGRPVRLRQRPEGAAADVEGEALRLEYRAAQDRLLLEGSASVRQGGDLFSGERIEYDIVHSRVQASGQDNGGGRVQAIIQPRGDGEQKP